MQDRLYREFKKRREKKEKAEKRSVVPSKRCESKRRNKKIRVVGEQLESFEYEL